MTATERFEQLFSTRAVRQAIREKSIRGALHTATSNGAEFVLRLASTVILARLIMPEEFGVMAMVLAVTSIAEQFRDLGLSAATVQKTDLTHQQVTNLFWINTAAGFAIAAGIACAAPLVSRFYGDPRLTVVTVLIATTFLWSGLAVQHQSLMRRQMHLGRLALVSLGSSLISTGIGILLAWQGLAYWALAWREVSRAVLLAAGYWLGSAWQPGWPNRGSRLGDLLRFGRDMTLTQLLAALIANVDRLVVGRLFGAITLGLYRQAQQLVMVPFEQLLSPITTVAQPGLSALQAQPDRYRRYYGKVVALVCLVTVPVGCLLCVYPSEVTRLLLGPNWLGASNYIWFFALAATIRPVIGTSAIVLISCGHTRRFLALAVVHAVLLLCLIIVGAHFGAEGVAVAHLLATLLLAIPKLHYSFLRTPVTLHLFGSALLAPALGALVMLGLLLAARYITLAFSDEVRVMVGGGIGLFGFVGALLATASGRRLLRELRGDLASVLRRSPRMPQKARAAGA